jgi:hypothetical protein
VCEWRALLGDNNMLKIFLQENQDDEIYQRNSYRRFIYVALVLLLLNYIVIGLLFMKLLTIKIPPNFATTSDGRLIQIKAND